jgi:hypothetical protein
MQQQKGRADKARKIRLHPRVECEAKILEPTARVNNDLIAIAGFVSSDALPVVTNIIGAKEKQRLLFTIERKSVRRRQSESRYRLSRRAQR